MFAVPCPLVPMQPTVARPPFHRDGWIYEEKIDGWPAAKGVDHTERFPELAAAITKLRTPELVLDGEVAVFNETLVSQFHLLNDLDPRVVCTPPLFMAFDCLSVGRRDLQPNPLHERRRALEDIVDGADLVLPVRRLAATGLDAWETRAAASIRRPRGQGRGQPVSNRRVTRVGQNQVSPGRAA